MRNCNYCNRCYYEHRCPYDNKLNFDDFEINNNCRPPFVPQIDNICRPTNICQNQCQNAILLILSGIIIGKTLD